MEPSQRTRPRNKPAVLQLLIVRVRERKASRPHPPARALRNSIESNITNGTFAGAHEREMQICAGPLARALFAAACSLGAHGGSRLLLLLDIVSRSGFERCCAVGTFPPPRVYVRNAVLRRLARSVAHPIVFSQTLAICAVPGHLGCVKTMGPSNTAVHVPPNPCSLKTASGHSIYSVTIAYGMKHMTPLPKT